MKYLTKWQGPVLRRVRRSAIRLRVSVVFAAVVAGALAQQPHGGLINSAGAVFNPATGKSYVVDSDGSGIEVINDRAGATRSVNTGSHPVSIAIDSQNDRAYVVNAGDGTVSVLDGKTDEVVATVRVGDHPYSIASDSAAGRIYVTRTYSNQLMVIDAATNDVSSIGAGSPDQLVINQKAHIIYLLSYEMGDLAILNGVTGAISRTSVGMHAWGMAINPETGTVFIGKPGDGQIAVIEPGSTRPAYIETGGLPCAVAVNERSNTIYVADYSRNSVQVIKGDRKQVVATIPVGIRPEALAVDTNHHRIYVANTGGLSVSVINGATHGVMRTELVGAPPYAISVNPAEQKVHIATLGRTRSASFFDR